MDIFYNGFNGIAAIPNSKFLALSEVTVFVSSHQIGVEEN